MVVLKLISSPSPPPQANPARAANRRKKRDDVNPRRDRTGLMEKERHDDDAQIITLSLSSVYWSGSHAEDEEEEEEQVKKRERKMCTVIHVEPYGYGTHV